MSTKIKIKRSDVPGHVPTNGQLEFGELAVNTADRKLFSKHSNGQIIELTGSGGTTVHELANTTSLGIFHTVSGLTAGQVLRASNSTNAAFSNLIATDIPELDASKITTGVFSTARLANGTANNSVFLRGDGNWFAVSFTNLTGTPTTLAGYGITDAQPLNINLTAYGNLATTGVVVRTGSGTVATRNVVGGDPGRITITNGDGLAGNISVDLATVANTGTGSFVKIQRDQYGRVTGTTPVTVTDIAGVVDPRYLLTAGDTMTGFLNLVGDPTQGQHAATKQYVDNTAGGLSAKNSCRVATTGNITRSGLITVDGVTLVSGNRVLVKNQNVGSQNGIYVASVGTWSRSNDFNGSPSGEVVSGAFVFVREGTVNGGTGWILATDDPITVGSTALVFVQFVGANQIVAGNGLTLTGTVIDVVSANTSNINVGPDSIDLQATGVIAGTYNNVTVDQFGRASAGSNQPYLLTNQTITLTGDATGSGTTSIGVSLANTGVTPGTYTKTTVDAKGRVTVGTSLDATDIPNIDASKITSGTFDTTRIGPGVANNSTWLRGDGWQTLPATSWGSIVGTLADQIDLNNALSLKADLAGATFTGKAITVASNTATAGFNVPHGTAPTTPVNGDFWSTTSAAFMRINGVTHQFANNSADSITVGQLALARGGTGASLTATAGAVAFSNSTTIAFTTAGTTGQVLTSAGAGTPTWTSQAALSANAANLAGIVPVTSGGTGFGSYVAGNFLRASNATHLEQRTSAQVLSDIGAAAAVHTHVIGDVTGLQPALDAKAPLANPAFTGNVSIGTGSTGTEKLEIASGAAEFALQWSSTGSKQWVLASASDRAYVRNKTDGIEPLTILNAGNVGVGNTNPVHRFSVNGTMFAANTFTGLRGASFGANASIFGWYGAFPSSTYITIEKPDEQQDASIVYTQAGAAKWEVGATTELPTASPRYHIKRAVGAAGAEAFTDVMVFEYDTLAAWLPQGVNFGVGTNPAERIHFADNPSAARFITKIENYSSSGSGSAVIQFAGRGGNWVEGIDFGLNGGNNWFVQGPQGIRLFADATGVAINGSTVAATEALRVDSTTGGFLPPRMTTTQRDAMGGKNAGLLIWNSTLAAYQVWNGSSWDTLSVGGGGGGATWTVITGATTLVAGGKYICNATGGSFSVTLPASVAATDEFVVHAVGNTVGVLSNGNIIRDVGAGNDLTVAATETAHLVGSATGFLEIV